MPPSLRPGPRRGFRATAILLGTLGALLLGEVAVRVRHGRILAPTNARGTYFRFLQSSYPATYDARLGWVPTPSSRSVDAGGRSITVGKDGLRSQSRCPSRERTILAVGDSFTWGDEVGDEDTWPARLACLLERPVLNGGVFGYGLDQTVLRAEDLASRFDPDLLIVSFIAHDIVRCEYAYFFAWKPYFRVAGGELNLHNVPVPVAARPRRYLLQQTLGYSDLADLLMRRLAPAYWKGETYDVKYGERKGVEIAGLLMKRLERLSEQTGRRVLVVAQAHYADDVHDLGRVVREGREAGLDVLDLSGPLRDLVTSDLSVQRRFFSQAQGHMTEAGNAWVAEQVAAHIRRGDDRGRAGQTGPGRH